MSCMKGSVAVQPYGARSTLPRPPREISPTQQAPSRRRGNVWMRRWPSACTAAPLALATNQRPNLASATGQPCTSHTLWATDRDPALPPPRLLLLPVASQPCPPEAGRCCFALLCAALLSSPHRRARFPALVAKRCAKRTPRTLDDITPNLFLLAPTPSSQFDSAADAASHFLFPAARLLPTALAHSSIPSLILPASILIHIAVAYPILPVATSPACSHDRPRCGQIPTLRGPPQRALHAGRY
ncbi:hypothetical protein BS50DRAFT_590980 [Corynespora cassiicola Philippines]|uniref:Uncharacterized protein n=1 Tax=Corynespora cassiicola Philippines TaxID=1448308 RepID=A0A2T2NF48_CORCC|nr:hypothetical protein BS50DRAFT_590980 [Corynespora cassiicola Philippines]